jgi:TrmH family RNA methyltransferase
VVITSTSNPRVRDVASLRKARERRSSGRFVVEGRRELERCLRAGVAVEAAYWCPELAGDRPPWLDHAGEVVEVSRPVFERMSGREGPDGVLGVAHGLGTALARIELPAAPLVLVLVGIEKPGNLGTMVRSALAAGATAVVLADPVTDATNPNAVRASQGAIFDLPVAATTSDEVLGWLAEHGVAAFAADPGAALPYWDAPLAGPCALVIGAEHAGLPDAWRAAATPVGIPMSGAEGADSLNASAAAAVLLFDAVRQRRTS